MSDRSTDARWVFGLEPLPQQTELAPLLRRVQGLALALDAAEPAVDELIAHLRAAESALADRAVEVRVPRLGDDAPDRGRPYLDHARGVGAYDAAFPDYEITIDGARATGTVTFPLIFEGPPGVVHGGALASFFDCVIQNHSCDLGIAGKTTSLHVEYRRPTPLATPLTFEIDREVDDRRITSLARLLHDGDLQCTATMQAVAGNRDNLPHVPPRRPAR